MEASALVRQARRDSGLTQAALAARLGMPQSVVARLERSGSNPTWDTLSRTLSATGHRLELRRSAASVDLDLDQLRRRLALTPADRLRLFQESQHELERLRMRARRRDAG
jgi:transcriptional regulator with XRE-family HTH domain